MELKQKNPQGVWGRKPHEKLFLGGLGGEAPQKDIYPYLAAGGDATIDCRGLRSGVEIGKSGFRALHRLGQNFLVDKNVLTEIAERSGASKDDVVLEIGPGHGVLTRALLERGCFVHAIELDERFKPELELLALEFKGRLALHWHDAVKFGYASLEPFPNRVTANIPYNITTPLIWRLLEFAPLGLDYLLLMVQKEAADRLVAGPDTRERYPLGVTIEAMGEAGAAGKPAVRVVRRVPASCFRPVPKVESALVEIFVRRNHELLEGGLWSGLLHRCFSMRRKTLRNNLKGFKGLSACEWDALLAEAGISPGDRAEDVEAVAWLRLYGLLRHRAAPCGP